MDRLSAFLDMGGYAAYVWPAYAVTAVVLVALLALSLRALKRGEAALEALRAEGRGPDSGEAADEA